METINPATGERLKTFDNWNEAEIDAALDRAAKSNSLWQATNFDERAKLFHRTAKHLRTHSEAYAHIITSEMGKLAREAQAEIEKCAVGCDFYAEHAETFLRDESVASDAGKSYISYQPLGTVLAVMPWNFPFWQVFRFAAPGLMAGNTAVLKHASNVPECALAIGQIFREVGFPEGVFQTLMISANQAEVVIRDPRIQAVTLTGSEVAGRKVAAVAGASLKKTVLELGGSDAFIVLGDADLDQAVQIGLASRFSNCGQSCIAAKRFILVDSIAETFLDRFKRAVQALRLGDPASEDTQLGPMARADLRDQLHQQVSESIESGATVALNGGPVSRPGFYYAPVILDHVRSGMRAYAEELFGPVAVVIRVADEEEAIRVANDNRYGLGASVFTRNTVNGEAVARRIHSGSSFVNGLVKSDPRLPFGGIKASGYGRELSAHGIREFTNIKTVWIQ